MRPFAEQTGFSGSDQEWQQEFDVLCRERGSTHGIRLDAFVTLVNDSSDDGCYCSDSELRNLLQPQTRPVPPKAPAPAAKSKAAQPTPPAGTPPPQEGPACLLMLVVCPRRFCVCVLFVLGGSATRADREGVSSAGRGREGLLDSRGDAALCRAGRLHWERPGVAARV